MRAIRIIQHGEPEGLAVAEIPTPEPGPSEVRIDVHAVGVNFPDLLVVRGTYQILAPLPFSPGKEVAGTVSAVGEGVSDFKIGDRVLAYVENGGYVEEIVVPAVLCHKMPSGLDFADAIGIGLAFQTAHFALFEHGKMQPGETVLVTGATGGVGISTIQLAKARGARVLAGCMTASKADFALRNGADAIIMLNRPDVRDSLRAEVAAANNGRLADVIVDNVNGAVLEACLRSLDWRGRIVIVGFTSDSYAPIRSNYLLIKNITATGLHWSDYRDRTPELVRQAQDDIFSLWREGKLRPPVTRAYRLEDAARALRDMADRKVLGKFVLLTARYEGRLQAGADVALA